MNELRAKFKRQIEILGIAIKNTGSLNSDDLAEMYGVERLTIKRDLQELRSRGIDIHSSGKRGVRLYNQIDTRTLQQILSSYLAISCIGSSIDRASALLTKKLGMESLNVAVTLQKCIEETQKVKFLYESEHTRESVEFIVEPLQIFQSEALWRLIAVHNDIVKQFLITKISDIIPMEERFVRPHDKYIEEMCRHSFFTWIGGEKYTVRLKLSKEMAKRLKSRQLISFEKVAKHKDGSIEVEGVVNSLREIAVWIVGLGKGVQVIEPKELKNYILKIAHEVIENY